MSVSLPSKWVKKYGVKAGDEVDVEEKGNTLTIAKEKSTAQKEITIEISSPDRFLKRFLVGPYIKGYDLIRVKYNNPEVYLLVQETMNRLLLGFEIVQHSKEECVLKNIVGDMSTEYDYNQRKFFLQIKTVVANLIEALEKKDKAALDHILLLDKTIDKLCTFMRRVLNTKGYKDDSTGKSLYFVNNLWESISDQCRNICKMIKETNKFPSDYFISVLKNIAECVEQYYQLFYKFDREKMADLKIAQMKIRKDIQKQLLDKKQDLILYHYLLSMIEAGHDIIEELG